VKKKKQDISLRELFRQKLENAEITPELSLGEKIMRAQNRREFLRFNAGRFNIYYIGAIVVTVVSALVILVHSSGKPEQVSPEKPLVEIVAPVNTMTSDSFSVQTDVKPSEVKNIKSFDLSHKKAAVSANKVTSQVLVQKIKVATENAVLSDTLNNKVVKNSLVSGVIPVEAKLPLSAKLPEVLFEASATEGCAPLSINFISKANASDSCRWSFGDGGFSDKRNPKWIFDVEGEYKIVLYIFDSDTIKATSTSTITVYPKPQARFEISPENAVLPKDEIHFYNYSTNSVRYSWKFGDGSSSDLFEPVHKYSRFGNYNVRLVASSDFGCSDSMTVVNAYSRSEYFINFPNAFVPNTQGPSGGYYSATSDESSLVFHPVSSGVAEYQLKIFSRLGILVFETNDINIGWDGYSKGHFSEPGVYIWKVRGSFRNGEPFVKTGDVTLLKY
jgi:PKD repeat protein